MQNVPNIVRERLKGSSQPAHHVDADMLTAFAERSLSALDRDIVLEHLAQCADCREIIALALPEQESPSTIIHPSRGWLTWPAMRWGFAAAGIAIVLSFGVVQYQRRSSDAIATRHAATKTVADAAQGEKSAAPSASPEAYRRPDLSSSTAMLASSSKSSEVQAPTRITARADEPTKENLAVRGRALGQLAHGPKMTANQLQQNANTFQAQAMPLAPAPLSKQQLDDDLRSAQAPASPAAVQIQADAVKTESAKNDAPKNLQQLVVHNEELSQQTSSYGTAELKRAKPAEQDALSGLAPKVPARSQTNGAEVRGAKILPVPRWSISSAGSLERSYDQGTTWQEVHVHDAPASGGRIVAGNEPGFNPVAKSKDSSADTESDANKKTIPAGFRAVAASGNEVWAGASGGLLYHSIDGGANWTRVIPAALGSSLTGDVIAIEFTDSQHGKVSTSTSQVWVTLDDGQSWSKQQ